MPAANKISVRSIRVADSENVTFRGAFLTDIKHLQLSDVLTKKGTSYNALMSVLQMGKILSDC